MDCTNYDDDDAECICHMTKYIDLHSCRLPSYFAILQAISLIVPSINCNQLVLSAAQCISAVYTIVDIIINSIIYVRQHLLKVIESWDGRMSLLSWSVYRIAHQYIQESHQFPFSSLSLIRFPPNCCCSTFKIRSSLF